MKTEKLYEIAQQNDITVEGYPLPENKAVTVQIGDKYFVAIDPKVLCSNSQEKVCLAHEIGHCRTGAVYTPGDNKQTLNKQEARALKWAIESLVPLDALREAIKNGCTDLSSLSEHFEVTDDFMCQVLIHYQKTM